MKLSSCSNSKSMVIANLILSLLTLAANQAWGTPYSSLVLSKSPVSYWRLGESSGTSAADETGANNGTYVNTPTLGVPGLITDDSDTAFQVDGSSEYADMGSPASLEFGGALTVTAWINADTLPNSGVDAIVGQWDNVVARDRFLLSLRTTGQIGVAIGNGASGISASQVGTSAVTLGQRHFVAFSWVDGAPGTTTMYFDGSVDPMTAAQSPLVNNILTSTTANFRIGAQVSGGGRYFDGIIDEVAVFNTVLSASDIQELYELGANGPPPVPEPSSLVLLGLGALALGRHARRRTNKS